MKDFNMKKMQNMAKKNQVKAPQRNFGRQPSFEGQQRTDFGTDDPKGIPSPFHNPYTFMPFPKNVERHNMSYLTADEQEQGRKTGVIELKVKTLSPLLSAAMEPYQTDESGHKFYHPLCIDDDVILPATSVRGSLRTLMTVLSGGTLGYLDTNIWLCQGRDLQLGPTMQNKNAPAILAKVVVPGNSQKDGIIELGMTDLISAKKLDACCPYTLSEYRKPGKKFFVDDFSAPRFFNEQNGNWEVKLSGRPVNTKGDKKEGVFKSNGQKISIPAKLWADYQGRNRFSGQRPELKKGDLIWLEPRNNAKGVTCSEDVVSLQWARWGKKGVNLKDSIPGCVLPDALRDDFKVDLVTDLFGQVPMEEHKALSFASRIRPHNLVFKEGMKQLERNVALAPLSSPHPGCVSFYRQGTYSDISKASPLKGYKIYRNSREKDSWKFSVQGIFGKNGKIQNENAVMNKTVDLLKAGQIGTLRIGFRALNDKELALLLAACSVDWKLGGGKPIGLGHSRVVELKVRLEDGSDLYDLKSKEDEPIALPTDVDVSTWKTRIELYQASQKPVDLMRYPLAVKKNNNDVRREGLQWFSLFSTPKKSEKKNENAKGLQSLSVGSNNYRGQVLPELNLAGDDFLYGYDVIPCEGVVGNNKKTCYERLEQFDPAKHCGNGSRGENTSPNRNFRQENRKERH